MCFKVSSDNRNRLFQRILRRMRCGEGIIKPWAHFPKNIYNYVFTVSDGRNDEDLTEMFKERYCRV
jgi:hypothetical protein